MRGYSLIECICALCIVSLLIAGVAHVTHRTSAILSTTSDTLQQRIAITKAGLVISASLAALERSHFPGLVTITNGDNPTTQHGTPHPVTGLRGNTRPRSGSAIISTVEVDPRYRGRIVKSSFVAGSISIEVCGSPEIPGSHTFRSHITVGVQGLCQMTGDIQRTTRGCFTLSGSIVRGVVTELCPPNSLLEYLPVIREQSIYIDRTGELRLTSHVGARIIENQPIVRDLRAIEILPITRDNRATMYRIDIFARTTRSHRFLFAAGLTREALWNEILL